MQKNVFSTIQNLAACGFQYHTTFFYKKFDDLYISQVDVILVLDQERVYNDLVRDMPDFVKVVWLPKSGGVVERPQDQRIQTRDARIKEYFYGPKGNLFPHTIEVSYFNQGVRFNKVHCRL